MSYDFRLDAVCPHQVVFEELALVNYEYLYPVSPVASSRVRVFVNENEVSQDGFYSKAHTFFSNLGTFTITSGVNDVLALSVDANTEQTITLNSGVLTAQQIVKDLSDKISNVDVALKNGYISISSRSFGDNSRLTWGNGTAHITLGAPVNKIYNGNLIYPGWGLVTDSNSIGGRKIAFRKPFKSSDDIIEVSYFTSAQYCRRCMGLKLENDFRYDTLGKKIRVEEENLMLQEVNKILLTLKKSNLFHTWYGTRLSSLSGTKYLDFVRGEILSEVRDALASLRDIKVQQATLQKVTTGEFPEVLSVLKLEQSEDDPTILNLEIEVMSRRGRPMTINQLIKISNIDATSNLSQGFIRRG